MLEKLHKANVNITEREIREFEQHWRINLPQTYREFLLENNGGRPEPSKFTILGFELNNEGTVQVFFGLGTKVRSSDLNWRLENLGVPRPAGLLPIACTPGDDLICLQTNHSGRVVFWDQRACWGKGKWKASDFYPVAGSFDDFLAQLRHPVPSDEVEKILQSDDVVVLAALLDSGYAIEAVDEEGRTFLERAAIAGRPAIIEFLHKKGAKLRNALQLAEQNFEFFPEHKETVDTIRRLTRTT